MQDPVKNFLRGAFTGAGGPQEAKDLSLTYLKIQASQYGLRASRIGKRKVFYFYHDVCLSNDLRSKLM